MLSDQNKFTLKNTWRLCNINRHSTRYNLKKHIIPQPRVTMAIKKKC